MKIIPGDEKLYLAHGGDYWVLTLDDVRRMYYVVLGMDPPLRPLQAEIDALRKTSIVAVDEPADVRKVEHVMRLNNALG